MKRVKDDQGHILKGVLKDDRGALIVNDQRGLLAYRKQQEAINNINAKIHELTEIVNYLKLAVESNSNNQSRTS